MGWVGGLILARRVPTAGAENANIMQSSGFITAGEDCGRHIAALIHGLIPETFCKM